MKISKYNLFFEWENNLKVAFNSFTTALAEVDSDFYYILNNLENINYNEQDDKLKSVYDEMIRLGFITEDITDELKILKYNQHLYRFNDLSLGLVIAPTLACNFKCDYCYENTKPGIMSDETLNKLEEMILNRIKTLKNLHITWYGGEPLLAKDLIFRFTNKIKKICKDNNVEFDATMISNGYLLDQETIDKLKQIELRSIQITLDGPPSVHNLRRKLINSKEGTFEKILNNIKMLKENKVPTVIRINVDKTNYNDIDEILDILIENKLNDIIVYLAQVISYNNVCKSISGNCFNIKEFADIDIKSIHKIINKGFKIDNFKHLFPSLHGNYCSADQNNIFVIDPSGKIYKCWNDVGEAERSIGNLDSTVKVTKNMIMTKINFIEWDPLDFEECKECNLAPICMGGCPFEGLINKKPKCVKWKYSIEDILKITYNCKATKREKEVVKHS